MSAALGAALKKIAVALLSDPKAMKKVLAIVLTLLVAIIMPIAAVIAIFSTDFEIDVPEFQRLAIQNLTPEQRADLQFIEDTGHEIQAALTARGQEKRLKEALVLFLFALGDFAHEPGFAEKLAGCFVEGQTHTELIAAVNAAFGTDIDPEDFEKIMSFVNRQIVDVARSQIGNVGGEPYWSWYGFPSRVEWCACFVSWCADQCGYIDAGIIPRFSGCEQGAGWFKARNLWQDGSATPTSGDIIFFDWLDENGLQDGSPDHVGIVEKVENGRVYTIEGNSGDACQQNSYPIGYFEIFGYGTPKYEIGGTEDDSQSNPPAQGA